MRAEHISRYLYATDFAQNYSSKQRSILDVGCGTGYGANYLARTGRYVRAIDVDKDVIKQAQKAYEKKHVQFVPFDLNTTSLLTLSIKNIGLITCFEVLEHIKNPRRVLKAMYSNLKNNGYIIISVPQEKFEPKYDNGILKNPHHMHTFTIESIQKMVKHANFEIVEVLGQPFTNVLMRYQKKSEYWFDKACSTNVSPDYFEALSRAVAYPSKHMIEQSYSIIVVGRKRYKAS